MTDDDRDRTPEAPRPPDQPRPAIDPDGPTVPMARPKLPPPPAEPSVPEPAPAPADPSGPEPGTVGAPSVPSGPAPADQGRAEPGEETVQLSAKDLTPQPAPPVPEPVTTPAPPVAEPVTPDGPSRVTAGAPAGASPVPVTPAVPTPGPEPRQHDSAPQSPGGRKDSAPGEGETAKPVARRLSSAGALIGVLLALFGFTLVVQLRSNDDNSELASARQEDLVRILSDLEARDQRLQQDITSLDDSRRQLTSGVAGREAALEEADKRAAELGLLSGTLPGRGPGLVVTLAAEDQEIKASAILNAVQELRGAGGEVMQLVGDNGVAVRIVASSYFVDAAGGSIVVDGQQLSGPYVLTVIGDGPTMQTALQIPGGVVASVSQGGGNVTMEQRATVDVTAVRQAASLQYARPVD